MATKVNLVLDDEVKQALAELVPAGERSRFANAALREALTLLRRRQAILRLGELRAQGPVLPAGEIVRALREDRASH